VDSLPLGDSLIYIHISYHHSPFSCRANTRIIYIYTNTRTNIPTYPSPLHLHHPPTSKLNDHPLSLIALLLIYVVALRKAIYYLLNSPHLTSPSPISQLASSRTPIFPPQLSRWESGRWSPENQVRKEHRLAGVRAGLCPSCAHDMPFGGFPQLQLGNYSSGGL
jgi:hypothetical protein